MHAMDQVQGSKDGSVDLKLICTFTRMREKLNLRGSKKKGPHAYVRESDVGDDIVKNIEEALKDSEVWIQTPKLFYCSSCFRSCDYKISIMKGEDINLNSQIQRVLDVFISRVDQSNRHPI